MDEKKKNKENHDLQELNGQLQGVDKAPGEEHGRKEKVTKDDLKGKKVDADPSEESGKPSK
jgi:hypothetical protein